MTKTLKVDAGRNMVLVDDDVYDWASNYNWFTKHNGYIFRWSRKPNGKRSMIYLHREIAGYNHPDVDHKDRDKSNNTRQNLRGCSRSQNLANKTKCTRKTSSKYKGVYFSKNHNNWVAVIISKPIKLNRRKFFKTEDEAAIQYNFWASSVFGEFAVLNEVSL